MNLIYHKTSSIGEFPLSRTIYKAMQCDDCFVISFNVHMKIRLRRRFSRLSPACPSS